MVKSRKQRVKNAKPKQPKQRGTMVSVDGAAMAHIKLMADPCMGRLVSPAYPTSTGGAVMRFRNIISLAAGTAETAGLFHWIPGNNEYFANGTIGTGAGFTPSAASMFTFLQTGNTSALGVSFRPVAACVRLIYNGSEQNRGGLVYAGNTSAASFGLPAGGATPNIGACLPILGFSARVPAQSMEVLWVPSDTDMGWSSDAANSGISNAPFVGESAGAITLAVVGLGAAVGVTLEVTGVYEVIYNGSGMTNAVGPPASSTPWTQTLKGFFNAIKGSTIVMDGIKSGLDYVSSMGPASIGANAVRAALTYI